MSVRTDNPPLFISYEEIKGDENYFYIELRRNTPVIANRHLCNKVECIQNILLDMRLYEKQINKKELGKYLDTYIHKTDKTKKHPHDEMSTLIFNVDDHPYMNTRINCIYIILLMIELPELCVHTYKIHDLSIGLNGTDDNYTNLIYFIDIKKRPDYSEELIYLRWIELLIHFPNVLGILYDITINDWDSKNDFVEWYKKQCEQCDGDYILFKKKEDKYTLNYLDDNDEFCKKQEGEAECKTYETNCEYYKDVNKCLPKKIRKTIHSLYHDSKCLYGFLLHYCLGEAFLREFYENLENKLLNKPYEQKYSTYIPNDVFVFFHKENEIKNFIDSGRIVKYENGLFEADRDNNLYLVHSSPTNSLNDCFVPFMEEEFEEYCDEYISSFVQTDLDPILINVRNKTRFNVELFEDKMMTIDEIYIRNLKFIKSIKLYICQAFDGSSLTHILWITCIDPNRGGELLINDKSVSYSIAIKRFVSVFVSTNNRHNNIQVDCNTYFNRNYYKKFENRNESKEWWISQGYDDPIKHMVDYIHGTEELAVSILNIINYFSGKEDCYYCGIIKLGEKKRKGNYYPAKIFMIKYDLLDKMHEKMINFSPTDIVSEDYSLLNKIKIFISGTSSKIRTYGEDYYYNKIIF